MKFEFTKEKKTKENDNNNNRTKAAKYKDGISTKQMLH